MSGIHARRRGRRATALAVVSSSVFMAMLDNLAMNNALPRIGTEMGLGVSGLQWVVAGYTLPFAACLLSGSVLGDRLGQRRAFVTGVLAFCAGSALSALAGEWALLVAGRVVQGIGAAVLMPASMALLRHVFTEPRGRTRAMGVRGGAGGLGVALGPTIGGPLVDAFGWRSVMWINLPVGAAVLLLALRTLPAVPPAPARWDPRGQLLAVTGLGGLVYALVQGPVDGWTDTAVLATLTLAGLALPAFAVAEARAAAPMLEVRLLRDPVAAAAATACFAASLGLFGSVFFLTLYLQNILDWSATGAGAVFLTASALIALTAPLAGALCARHGARLPLIWGLALCTVALLGLSRLGRDAAYGSYGWLLPVLGTGVGLTFVSAVIAVVQRAPADRTAMASALMDTLRELGGVVGVAALGAVLTGRMHTSLYERATAGGLPEGRAHDLVGSVLRHGAASGLDAATGPSAAAARTWVEQSFVSGLHAALFSGALVLFGAAAVVTLLLRGDRAVAAERSLPLAG
ncbi:DHA2 family efflux MFS transporter permease subunit [Streptomyces sp. AV19]|uniref:DHA2 family efflux MFS transporter permease subunit n=1 Tax=Streptomyces sp. AV19 TaxID=2793068 RepID=UPI0018FE3B8C|nr:DHA2 family efflux MFS transporter permease subunit [Streptomyces sp. AV19]MBH1935805.1 DHA2 family efflux MFS transporter permease subunit [Streptomyces sp. AV19]MDG4536107.1 DHA2 family efflux MFS transporter permease subunit [Streptomyces sp. AV19]